MLHFRVLDCFGDFLVEGEEKEKVVDGTQKKKTKEENRDVEKENVLSGT